jgi:mannose-1-phosphate guanylyltransferase
MRAMILAAGLGTRMRPLSNLRAKPALPVRGRPVISLLLEFLARQGFRDVMVNLHHLGDSIRTAIAADRPSEVAIHWSEEPEPLGTGGGIRRASEFLCGDEACVVLAGDMLIDLPLADAFDRHVASGRHATLLLREDSRGGNFGTIGVDAKGHLSRISETPLGGEDERARGLFTGVRLFSRGMLDNWPRQADGAVRNVFEDLRDWMIPGIVSRGEHVGAEIVDADSTVWEPIGTPAEYLQANLSPPDLPTLGGSAEVWAGEIDLLGPNSDAVVSRKAIVADDAVLERCVVWDGERIPPGLRLRDGVYAGGVFHACGGAEPGSVH